jgi:butyryl-CoA dehydrogenase
MAEQFISDRNLKFLLYEVFNAEDLLAYPRYAEHSREVFDMVLETALKMARDLFKPIVSEMDKMPPVYAGGDVAVHPAVRTIMREAGAGGWIGATFSYEDGGQQLPEMVGMMAPTAIFSAANYSAAVYQGLTAGAAGLIASFGTKEMKDRYLPKMLAGEWQGTMALTEPQAGSSLSDITLAGEPTDQGYYKMKGQKIFISAGAHDGVDNVVHLAIGRIKGAPAGVKGISFCSSFHRNGSAPEATSKPTTSTAPAFTISSVTGGAPITHLAFGENDDCRGWLVGEANKGLGYMFQMMNGAGSMSAGRVLHRLRRVLRVARVCPAAAPGAQACVEESPRGAGRHHRTSGHQAHLLFQKAVVEGIAVAAHAVQPLRRHGKGDNRRDARKLQSASGVAYAGGQVLSVGDGNFVVQPGLADPRRLRLLR